MIDVRGDCDCDCDCAFIRFPADDRTLLLTVVLWPLAAAEPLSPTALRAPNTVVRHRIIAHCLSSLTLTLTVLLLFTDVGRSEANAVRSPGCVRRSRAADPMQHQRRRRRLRLRRRRCRSGGSERRRRGAVGGRSEHWRRRGAARRARRGRAAVAAVAAAQYSAGAHYSAPLRHRHRRRCCRRRRRGCRSPSPTITSSPSSASSLLLSSSRFARRFDEELHRVELRFDAPSRANFRCR